MLLLMPSYIIAIMLLVLLFLIVSYITSIFIYIFKYCLGDCEPGWLKHEQHCYFINNTGDSWMNSKVGLQISRIISSQMKIIYIEMITSSRTGRKENGMY